MKNTCQCIRLSLPISPSFVIPLPNSPTLSLHPPPPPLLFVYTDSWAYISKVMWNVTNDPPATSPLKSILCQKDKMSRGRIFSAAAWPRRLFVLLRLTLTCVREGKKDWPTGLFSMFNVKRSCRLVRFTAGLCWSVIFFLLRLMLIVSVHVCLRDRWI